MLSQAKYLSVQAQDHAMHAIVTVRVRGAAAAAEGAGLAEVLVIDCSDSMTWPQSKFRAAKNATGAAVGLLPDGTRFAVVEGTHTAQMAYPDAESMPVAGPDRRAAAQQAVHALVASGGTAIGAWLDLSRRLLDGQSAPIRHVLLVTDGKNEHDEQQPLDEVLDACAGRFVCDAWGIGDGWDAQELIRIASRLHGRADAVREESELAESYQELMREVLTRAVPELRIRVTPVSGSAIRFFRQVYPTEMDLTADGRRLGDGAVEYTTRAWGDEIRRFHLCLSADPAGRPREEDLQLGYVEVAAGTERLAAPDPVPVVVQWTDDPVAVTRTDRQVLHFERYRDLGQAVGRAYDAYRAQDGERARNELGIAVALAHGLRAHRQLRQLERLVEIRDPLDGLVELRPELADIDFQHLITASTHSTFGPEPEPPYGMGDLGPDGAQSTRGCPHCAALSPVYANNCAGCGRGLREQP